MSELFDKLTNESEAMAEKAIELTEATPPVVVMVDLCEGCERFKVSNCAYSEDQRSRQHTRIGGCAMDTRKAEKVKDDFKLNPLKASKRGVK